MMSAVASVGHAVATQNAEVIATVREDRTPVSAASTGSDQAGMPCAGLGLKTPDKMQPDRSGRAMESSTVWIYVDINHRIDHPDHLKVFADQDAVYAWFAKYDREGVAFESCDRDAQSNTAAIRARAAGVIGTTDRARAALFRAATAW
jgi:hypothetical protein